MTDLYHHLTIFLKELRGSGEKPLLVVCGPTASGKTKLGLQLARDFNGEIISADAIQVYRKMNIGADKIDATTQEEIKHYLVDIRDPDQGFNVSDFQREAHWAIGQIEAKAKLPIICGGTGLYISSLTENYELQKAPPSPEIREELQREYEVKGKDHLYQMLVELDPVAASKIHPNNVRYVARALEIILQTKKPLAPQKKRALFNSFKMAINWDREILYDRINKRVDEMIEQGLIEEIQGLLAEGYTEDLQALQALGYKEYFPYLRGEANLQTCVDQHKQNTRNFAKRQLTWFRRDDDIYWIEPEEFYAITHA